MGVLSDISRTSQNSDISKSYSATFTVIPTTLTIGLHYFSLRNTNATKKIRINRIETAQYFVGTAAASRSTYTVNKYTGVTATAGTAVDPLKRSTSNDTSIAEVKQAPTGFVLTGAVLQARVVTLGHPNQVNASLGKDWDFSNFPIELAQNETLTLTSESAIVAGSTVHISIQWSEV
jgi:hypothetical protein